MCGIAGCYQQADGQKLVDIMTERIVHRGPDSTGIWAHEDDRVSVQFASDDSRSSIKRRS